MTLIVFRFNLIKNRYISFVVGLVDTYIEMVDTHFGDISEYMVDGQLALKTNHLYLYQVMSPIKLEICVYTATYKLYFMAGGKKTGYKAIFYRVVWLVKVSIYGNTIYIYISIHRNKANNAGCKHRRELHTLVFNLFY